MSLRNGMKLGPYEILSPLGAGGMGEVYRARDTRLDRDVAIKVLPSATARDAQALARFEREAKAVAGVSHPNILAVHDVGRHGDVSYVVTELLEGETLRQVLSDGAIGRRRTLEIAVAVADGLAAAHARGVVHRDLKPENIFITNDGVVKILDFGLARMEDPSRQPDAHAAHTPTVTLYTIPGTVLGTINYMSPEQIRAQRTDARSDVFSFGCVLHEMLTGERAFQGETSADTMTAILREAPKSIHSKRQDVGPDLERVIERCLEKKPEVRFQSSQDLAFSLRSILADSGPMLTTEPKPPARRTRWIIAVAGAGLAVVAFFVVRQQLRAPGSETRPAIASLAVLPLDNVSRDPEQDYFVDGMTEALIFDLAKIGGLKVISRTSTMRLKGTDKSLPEIARELNVEAIVEGSVQRAGNRVRITAQLIRAATDEHLWADSYDRDLGDILGLQSEVARTIAQQIKGTLTPQEHARMSEARSVAPDAYEAYSKGRFYWNKRTAEGIEKAIEYFDRAVQLSPDWPLAHAGLGDAYALAPWYTTIRPADAIPKAKAAATKALELDETLGEPHATLGVIFTDYDWNWSAAEREYQQALRLSPNYATGYHWYSLYLRYVGRTREALVAITKAQELDPLSLVIGINVGQTFFHLADYAQAEASYRRTLELDPKFALAHQNLANTLLLAGRGADAIAAAKEAARLTQNAPMQLGTLGHVCARAGQREEALRIIDDLAARSAKTYIAPTHFALVYAGLDDRDSMLEWLEKAYQEHDPMLPITLTDPTLAGMRVDPRFADLLRRVGLPQSSP